MSIAQHRKMVLKFPSTRVWPCFLVVVLVISVAALIVKSAFADGFWESIAIVNNLAPIQNSGNAGKRSVNLDIRFTVNSAKLTDAARRQLNALGEALKSDRLVESRFEINGHTDASGAADFNKALSEKRAQAVKSYLVNRYGIDVPRLTAIGWGEERPINSINPKSAENRRVEIVNLTPISNKTDKGYQVIK